MNRTKIIWINVAIFSFIGGLLPKLWGAELFSFEAVIFNGIGGLFGIWVAYKMIKNF